MDWKWGVGYRLLHGHSLKEVEESTWRLPAFIDVDLSWLLRASGEQVVKIATGHMPMKIVSCVTSPVGCQYLIYHKSLHRCTPLFTRRGEVNGSVSPRFHPGLYHPVTTSVQQP